MQRTLHDPDTSSQSYPIHQFSNKDLLISPHQSQQSAQRNKYGNQLIIYDQKCMIALGPDYWCFLPTFIVFCLMSFFMIKFVIEYGENVYFKVGTVVVCVGMPLSYLAVAVSNPGIVTQEDVSQNEQQENPMNKDQSTSRRRLCRTCNILVRRGTYHCFYCDVCVRDFDHHCPWTSKCIGGGNIRRFYIFLGCVAVYFVYVFIAFAVLMSSIALENATYHLRNAVIKKY